MKHFVQIPHSQAYAKFAGSPVFVLSKGLHYGYDGLNWWDIEKMRPGPRPGVTESSPAPSKTLWKW